MGGVPFWRGLALACVAFARAAFATTADDLCSSTADPCVVDRVISVTPDSTLDVGARALEIARTGTLDVGSGTMTIRARSLRMIPTGSLLARGGSAGGTIIVITTGDIAIERSGSSLARIDLSADATPGRLELRAGGALTHSGTILSRALAASGAGGNITFVAGGDLAITGTTTATGGAAAVGGTVSATATGALTVDTAIDASGGGGGGGTIDLEGGTVTTTALLDVSARTAPGDGGTVAIGGAGAVAVRAPIAAGSACGQTAGCGSRGGDVSIDAGDTILLAAQIGVTGASPDGQAGVIAIDAGTDVVQTGAFLARGIGAGGCGGEVAVAAGRNLTLGPVDVSGGFCGGGSVDVEAFASLAVAGEVNADSASTGPGGDVALSGQVTTVTAGVHANGPSLWGGTIGIDGCTVEIPSGVQVATRGDQGVNLVAASGLMTIGGTFVSGTGSSGSGGRNELRFRDPALPPVVTGASFTPAQTAINDPLLPMCRGSLPPGCGNGQLDEGEDCDDENTTACDGCSADCHLEGCGNGTTECAEECDDNNSNACDGCSTACQTEECGNGVTECAEECDDGPENGMPASGCDATCHLGPLPGCGDGTTGAGEECDDSNTTDCDGCSHLCRLEVCGNGTTECVEQCDDGGTVSGDGCRDNCTREVCGDDILDPQEECDDGTANGLPGASCDITCHPATLCGIITTEPPCVPCVLDTECDPLGRCAGLACLSGVCTLVGALDCTDGIPGTIDRCQLAGDGVPRCMHTCLNDRACDDGDPCDGPERCAAGTCAQGAVAPCDDGDPCTDDGCDAVRGCLPVPRAGLSGVSCRVDAMQSALAAASEDQISTRVARRLGLRLKRLRTQVDVAIGAEASGDGKRELRALRRVTAELLRVGGVVGRARGRQQISTVLADTLVTAVTGAYQTVSALRVALTS